MARSLPAEAKAAAPKNTRRKKLPAKEAVLNPLHLDKRTLTAMRVGRQVEAIKMLERALNAAKRR
jgi:hypothetical protein